MKKYGSSILVTLAVVLIIYGIYRWSTETRSPSLQAVEVDEAHLEEEALDPSQMGDPAPETVPAEPSGPPQPSIAQQFSEAMQQLGECLEIPPPQVEMSNGVSITAFEDAFNNDLGSVIFREDEWTVTDIRLPSGEARRLFVQSGIGDTDTIERRLRYYSVGPQGELMDLPLTQEQRINPSETLLASLESDGRVTGRSSSRKVFTQSGAELHMAEAQGRVYSFEVIFEGKSFRCVNLSDCSCL